MRRIISAVLTAFFLAFSAAPALAADRQIVYPSQNPSSSETNGQARFTRLAFGTWIRDALGPTLSAGGVYNDLSASPNGGMYVAVGPTQANTLGALYQLAADDPNPLPAGVYTPQLSADATKIIVQALQSSPSGSIGPLSAPASGNSQYYLIEAQVQTVDTTPLAMTFLNGSGTPSTLTVNTVRSDQIVYQAKAGVAAPSNPAVPTVDSGWIGIATVLVPSGTSTITSGMIAALPAFSGFVASGTNVTVSGLTISSLSTAGCLQNTSSGGVISSPCTSGLGSVVGTNPITATTSAGVATVGCTICVTSVSGSGNIASTGGTTPSVSLTGTVPFTNLPTTVAQTNVNNNFSVTQNFQAIAPTSASLSGPLNFTGSTASGAATSEIYTDANAGDMIFSVPTGKDFFFQQAQSSKSYIDVNGTYNVKSSLYGQSASVAGSVAGAQGGVFGGSQSAGADGLDVLNHDGTYSLAMRDDNSGTAYLELLNSAYIKAVNSTYGPSGASVNGNVSSAGNFQLTANANGTPYIGLDSPTVTAPGLNFIAPVSPMTNGFRFFDGGTATDLFSIGTTQGQVSVDQNGIVRANGAGRFTSPGSGTGGAVVVQDASGNTNAAYLQFTNNTDTSQYAYVHGLAAGGLDLNGDGTINGSGLSVTGYVDATSSITAASSLGSGNYDFLKLGSSCTTSSPLTFSINTGAQTQGVVPSAWGNYCGSSGWIISVDTSGDAGFKGNVTAAAFYTGSRRAWKTDIVNYRFDPLTLLGHVDYKEYACKDPRCGPVGMHKVGIIADDSPSQISGKKHDHYDAFALAAIDGAAIVELHKQVLLQQREIDTLTASFIVLLFVAAAFAVVQARRG